VALPGVVCDPGLARRHRALQADLHRRGVGADPSVPHDDGVHGDLRALGQAAQRGRCALCGTGVCWDAALAVFLHGAQQLLRQSDHQCQPADQGVFPAPHRAGLGGDHKLCGFPAFISHSGRFDGVVSVVAELATPHLAALGGRGLCGQYGRRVVVGQPQRAIPRLSLCGAVPCAVWAVREPCWILERDCAG